MNDLGAQLRRVEVVANDDSETLNSSRRLEQTVGTNPTVERITT